MLTFSISQESYGVHLRSILYFLYCIMLKVTVKELTSDALLKRKYGHDARKHVFGAYDQVILKTSLLS